MLQLENLIDPSVFRRFIQRFFNVRCFAKFRCGTSTDMIIEQSLMKSMQTDGGISRGRSTQESVISKWVYSVHAMNTVCEGLEDLANVKVDTTDKHVDASDSLVKRGTEDIKKLLEWFLLHDPFPVFEKIISIASGVFGDEKISSRNAREVGITSMTRTFGQTFNNIKLKYVDKVLPFLTISSAIKVHDEKVPIDPVLLFQRMSITKSFEDELQTFFKYELALYPLSLFDATGMCKTQKSTIYDCFQRTNVEVDNTNTTYIIDGGYLLHRVV
ncbi:hypothetical protein AVEN_153682-1 [Araneus ventricosus]|uniref:Uncharacterized protein n=1 Tax=Araneus ventricosus TaxID=182803 RepID=A0A4Y2G449_ARAVE|nr:hypothetical protein AVEN_153682-1 [Araneus ventricosus]